MNNDWPGKAGLLKKPFRIKGTNIEVIRPFNSKGLSAVLFDFDGTLSLERQGWVNLMTSMHVSALLTAVPNIKREEALEWALTDIEKSSGIPCYVQMKRLSEHIRELGGKDLGPRHYMNDYATARAKIVHSRHLAVQSGKLLISDLRVKGAINLLEELIFTGFEKKMFLASGTDIAPVKESLAFLGYDKYFGNNVLASGSTNNPEDDAKQIIVAKLNKELSKQKGRILSFGDDFPDLLYAYKTGGVCVGVLTPYESDYEKQGYFTLKKKRERLIKAGAHILVPDYIHAKELVNIIKQGF